MWIKYNQIISANKTRNVSWGQSEPLTTSIANCLDDYKDGLTIPKELIQNADDAGASEVCFLFDERTNLEWRDGLIDEGMAD
jgi:sacsin